MTTQTRSKAAGFGYRVARVFHRAWHLTDRPERALGRRIGHTVASGIFLLFKLAVLVSATIMAWYLMLVFLMAWIIATAIKGGYYDYGSDESVIESNSFDYGYDHYTDPIRADFDPCGAYHSMFDDKY